MNKKILAVPVILLVAGMLSFNVNAAGSANLNETVTTTVDPTITLSSSTPTISFGNVNPLTATYDSSAVTLTVQSNSQYRITAQAAGNFIGQTNPLHTIDIGNLKVKATADTTWLTVDDASPVTVIDAQTSTASRTHDVGFRFTTGWVNHEPDNYTATVTLTAEQF